ARAADRRGRRAAGGCDQGCGWARDPGAGSPVGTSSPAERHSSRLAGRAATIGDTPAVRFEHVLVVGAGQMGGGIAQVVAASGRRVSLHDELPGAVDRALLATGRSLEKLAQKGGADPDEVLARVTAVDGLVPADLMIEAVVEDAAV